MTDPKPSYVLKADRAEKHLVDLKDAIARYRKSHPYAVSAADESKKKKNVRRLHFTRGPDDDIALIAGDFIYNLRASLDHLMAALVEPKHRRSVYFPIYFQGVWDDPVEGENAQRTEDRRRWKSYTSKVKPEALTVLQELQPADNARDSPDTMDGLLALNELAVKDRHSKLPIVVASLADSVVTWQMPDGSRHTARAALADDQVLEDDAEMMSLPYRAMNVQIQGTPLVLLRVGPKEWGSGGYLIPDGFEPFLIGTRLIIERLSPFVR